MSKITFECPHCAKVTTVSGTFAGKQGKCPGCKKVIEIPDPYEDGEAIGEPIEEDEPAPRRRRTTKRGTGRRRTTRGGGGGGRSASEDETGERECPFCGEEIKAVAKKCKHCGEFLDRRLRQNRRGGRRGRRQSQSDKPMEPVDWVLCLLCSTIGCILGVVYLAQGQHKRGGMMIVISIVWSTILQILIMAAGGGR